jgi:hypothetical protein
VLAKPKSNYGCKSQEQIADYFWRAGAGWSKPKGSMPILIVTFTELAKIFDYAAEI